MSLIRQRIDRIREIAFLARRHVAGPAAIGALVSCYAGILHDPMSNAPVALALRHRGRRLTLQMRKSDIFTVAELFRERQYALTRSLGATPRIVDAGANVGVASAWFLLEHPGARVLAVEPASGNFGFLQATFGARPDVSLVRAALGDREGTIELVLAEHGAEHSVHANRGSAGTETVPSRRLDRLLDEHGFDRIDLLKLDVEGSEIEVLRGLGDRLDSVAAIVGEVHERQIDVGAFYALLDDHRFDVVRREYFGEGKTHGVHTVEAWRCPA